jgi:gliding motility-associated-like protein
MGRAFFLLVIFLGLSLQLAAQREASNWYFGDNAGINFDLNNSVTPLTDGQLATDEGCTSISDTSGQLLFYTDGIRVYNRNHVIMPNGSNLNGNPSSTQSAIIIPKPGDANIYYIFTASTAFGGAPDLGFQFSEVDMTLDNGLGDITTLKNQLLLNNASEKLGAVLKDCQTQNIWVVTFADRTGGETNNTFYAYEVTNTGVNTTPVTSLLPISVNERRGYLKFSPSGEKLAAANVGGGLYLFDFDLTTGTVSNPLLIPISYRRTANEPQRSYGVEFSPDNNLLYVTTYYETPQAQFNNPSAQYGALLQYNLNAPSIPASETVIFNSQTYRTALQLGPDGKIYRTTSATYDQGLSFLSVINNPNNIGTACNYSDKSIGLANRLSRQGLPPFIASFFSENIDIIPDNMSTSTNLPLCTGDNYTLIADDIPGATYVWTKDDVVLAETDFDLVVTEAGNYKVTIDDNSGTCNSLIGEAVVTYFDIPTATMPNNIFVCDDNNDDISNFDFSTQNTDILNGQDNTLFEVKYYSTLNNAMSDTNPITGTYQNTSVPQTIHARVQNIGNPNCFALTQFQIGVYDSPMIVSLANFEACDDTSDGNDSNGQTTINLSSFNASILGSQNASEFTITYHLNNTDAISGNGSLGNSYYNTTPFNQTLHVRIENNLNEDCFETASFEVTINPVPTANNATLKQCDEDGISDGITQFNLNEAYNDITNNSTTSTIIFYPTLANANSETSPISGGNYTNTLPNETVYAVVTDSNSQCKKIAELNLEISNTQISDYIAPEVCDELDSEDGLNTFNLNDFTSIILNGLPAGITLNYYETFNDAVLENNPLPLTYTNTTPYNQTIYARAESGNDCFGINEITLTINPRPQLDDDELIFYCLNDFPITQVLDSGLMGNPNDFNFSWSTGETTPTIQVNEIGVYSVTVTNANTGCQKIKTITIESSDIAVITQPIFINDGNSLNNVVDVSVTGEGIYEYALLNQNGDFYGYQETGLFYYIPAGIYTVMVKDIKNNCGIAEQLISVVGFPNFFTPNNDGFNDYWQVYGVNEMFQADAEIYIFDRYGKLLTRINPTGLGWDGTYNGTPMPTNDYWFMVTLEDGRVYKNNFTLKR